MLPTTTIRRNSVGALIESDTLDSVDELSGGEPLGYVQYTDLANAMHLEPPAGAGYAMLQAEGQAMRWRDDGQDPTPTVGMRLDATGELRYDGDLSKFRIIGEAAGAILNVSYYGAVPNA